VDNSFCVKSVEAWWLDVGWR